MRFTAIRVQDRCVGMDADQPCAEQQICYAPILMPLAYVPCQQVPPLTLPPSKVEEENSDCSRSVAESVANDMSYQLECAMQYQREWCEMEDNLFVRVFPLSLISQCFVENDAGDFRCFGTNSDWEQIFQNLGGKFQSVAVMRQSCMSVTVMDYKGERKIMLPKHGLRRIRSYPDLLGILINSENEVFHLQVAYKEEEKMAPDVEKMLVFAIVSSAGKDISKHISFW